MSLGVGGGIVPLLHGADDRLPSPEWGFVLLAAAGGFVLADRLSGFSSSWMRFMRTQAALQYEVNRARVRYLAWRSGTSGGEAAQPAQTREFFRIIDGLMTAIAKSVLEETSVWADDLVVQIEQATSRLTALPQGDDLVNGPKVAQAPIAGRRGG